MAEIIPPLNKVTLARMTAGEKRVARQLETLLEDDYLVWYDIPVGSKRRYPDFIILHPIRGLLFLEVKDWKPTTLRNITKTDVTLLTDKGMVTKAHPLEQARQYTYSVVNLLSHDALLCQTSGKYKGNLAMPYGWGVIFTNITRDQMKSSLSDEQRELVLPDHLICYKDDISGNIDAEAFQEKLWNMFHHPFEAVLTLPQINRIRWHLFPEVRIAEGINNDLFDEVDDKLSDITVQLPNIIKIMDIQQEQLARSLGDGHRVIHGVAGSGKTMILGYRCLYLSEALTKPILVLAFNITLAAKLRAFISKKGIADKVQVYHFHDWCGQQLKTYHIDVIGGSEPYWERMVTSVIDAVEKEDIPAEQYGAVLIDEGHDFKADWLKLVVQMIDPENDSLLLLYDDAQSIYKNHSKLGFSLSSVGIQATGRTTILRLNYRNTKEILEFAYSFVSHYLAPQSADDDHIPIIEPETAGASGAEPIVKQFETLAEEIFHSVSTLQAWYTDGTPWNNIAILCTSTYQAKMVAEQLQKTEIPHLLLTTKQTKKIYDPAVSQVSVLTIHSSKGLEFARVIMLGVGQMKSDENSQKRDARLLYVGMTRAQECLLVSTSSDNLYSKQLLRIGAS